MNKGKIAFIVDGLDFGGIERVALDYLNIFLELGYDVDVYNTNPKAKILSDKIPSKFNYYNIRIPLSLCPDRFALLAKKNRLGIFLFPILYLISFVLLLIIKLYYRLKFIRKSYYLAISFAGHYRDATVNAYNIIKSKKKIVWSHGAAIEYVIINYTYIYLFNKIHNIVSLCSVGDEYLRVNNKFLNVNIKQIYNPTYVLDKFKPNDDLKTKYGDYILNVARFEKQKDHKTIIKCIMLLRKKGIYNLYICYSS